MGFAYFIITQPKSGTATGSEICWKYSRKRTGGSRTPPSIDPGKKKFIVHLTFLNILITIVNSVFSICW